MRFRIELDVYHGPLDLLLYLVRKHEVDVADIAIAKVTEQYLDYLAVLEKIDVDAVGDFLDMASLLIEIKSRAVVPGEEEVQDELEDPRQELVRRLLEYKQYRDAASMLEERSRQWRERFPRFANDLPSRPLQAADAPLQEVELWDLVSVFGRVLKAKHAVTGPENFSAKSGSSAVMSRFPPSLRS
jgi:segregation and condensation protein A